ncbi:hypothetical protein JYK21_08155 [Ralstonia pickettii]|nr:hypothetical protein [Ralstonia pickettii]
MDLIDKQVVHKSFGKGNIIDQDDKFITINFKTESKKFIYPDAFGKYLTLEDRDAAQSLKKVITKIEVEQEKLEKQREAEKAQKLLEQQRIEEHKKLMKNHKLHPVSQLVFWLDEKEDSNVFNEWQVFTGEIKSGNNKGQPNKPVRLHQNSAVILTKRNEEQDEKERIILGIYMVNETFIGKLCDDGLVPAHSEYKIALSEKEAEKMLFWNYYINEKYPHRLTWNTGKYRYFDNIWTAQMLKDIIALKTDPEEKQLAKDFLEHFCKMNLIEIDEIPERAGALIKN